MNSTVRLHYLSETSCVCCENFTENNSFGTGDGNKRYTALRHGADIMCFGRKRFYFMTNNIPNTYTVCYKLPNVIIQT